MRRSGRGRSCPDRSPSAEEGLGLACLAVGLQPTHDLTPHEVHVRVLHLGVVRAPTLMAEQHGDSRALHRWAQLPGDRGPRPVRKVALAAPCNMLTRLQPIYTLFPDTPRFRYVQRSAPDRGGHQD